MAKYGVNEQTRSRAHVIPKTFKKNARERGFIIHGAAGGGRGRYQTPRRRLATRRRPFQATTLTGKRNGAAAPAPAKQAKGSSESAMAARFVVFLLPILLLEGVAAEATTHRLRGDAGPGTQVVNAGPGTQVVNGDAPFTPLQLDNVSSAPSLAPTAHSLTLSRPQRVRSRTPLLSSPHNTFAPSLAPTQPVVAAAEPPQPQPSDPAWKGSSRWPATGNPAHTHAKRAPSLYRFSALRAQEPQWRRGIQPHW